MKILLTLAIGVIVSARPAFASSAGTAGTFDLGPAGIAALDAARGAGTTNGCLPGQVLDNARPEQVLDFNSNLCHPPLRPPTPTVDQILLTPELMSRMLAPNPNPIPLALCQPGQVLQASGQLCVPSIDNSQNLNGLPTFGSPPPPTPIPEPTVTSGG